MMDVYEVGKLHLSPLYLTRSAILNEEQLDCSITLRISICSSGQQVALLYFTCAHTSGNCVAVLVVVMGSMQTCIVDSCGLRSKKGIDGTYEVIKAYS